MNLSEFMNAYQQFKANPMQMLMQRFNIPQNMNNPNEILQHLLNTGQITQDQVNQAMQLRNNPIIQQMMKR